MTSKEKIINSRARVREQGEVYTPITIVKEMTEMISDDISNRSKKVLEPTCGNGNFLVEILERRLKKIPKKFRVVDREFLVLETLSNIYGIDILLDNVRDARNRLLRMTRSYFTKVKNTKDFWDAAETIVERNIIHGDSLKHKSGIVILEWTPLKNTRGFEINPHTLAQIETDLKDVFTAPAVSDIRDVVFDFFSPKQKGHSLKKTSPENERQNSLFGERGFK